MPVGQVQPCVGLLKWTKMVIAINKVLIIFNGGKINETSIHPLIRSLLIIQSRVTGAPEPDDRQAAAPDMTPVCWRPKMKQLQVKG